MCDLATKITTSALDAARAEGRIQAAEEFHRLAQTLLAYAQHGCSRCEQFRAELLDMIAGHIEQYRREQSRAIDKYVEVRRELVQ